MRWQGFKGTSVAHVVTRVGRVYQTACGMAFEESDLQRDQDPTLVRCWMCDNDRSRSKPGPLFDEARS